METIFLKILDRMLYYILAQILPQHIVMSTRKMPSQNVCLYLDSSKNCNQKG